MSKRFTPEFRTTILQLLDSNRGNITLTSLQTGISERTLYDWRRRRELQQQQIQPHTLLQSLPVLQQQQNETDELNILRDSMMQTAIAIADSLKVNIDSRSLNVRVNALTSLLDRIMKLDSECPTEGGTQTIQIEYVDAEGRIYAAPPWVTDNEQKSPSHIERGITIS
jgi:transposase-like protein